jgi:hypothetical protein
MDMTRQDALRLLWKRLLGMLILLLVVSSGILLSAETANTGLLVFLIGNVGGYVGVHRSLGELKDAEVVELAASWWSIVAPSVVGGVLALVLYMLFVSGNIAGGLFPRFSPDKAAAQDTVLSIVNQHAEGMAEYAKLFFWSFIGGFNQKYVVDIINSVKAK